MIRSIKNQIIHISIIFIVAFSLSSCTGNEWPQFRGPDNNMIAKGTNLPTEWGDGKNVKWTYEIDGDSWSSPVIWGNKAFIASVFPVQISPPSESQSASSQEEDKSYLEDVYRWQLACVDLQSGKEMWKQVAFEGNPRTKKHRSTNYSGGTPVTDGKRVYVYFGMRGLYCYGLEGELLWEKDLGAYKTRNGWGTGSSPVIYKDVLFVQVDNELNSFLVALDSKTGDEIWKMARDEKTSYSSPVIWKNSVRTELVTGGKKARGYDPESGKVFWELHMAGHYNIPSAVVEKDLLFIGNAGRRDTPSTFFAIKAGAEGDITPAEGEETSSGVEWSNLNAPTGNPSPLLYNGLLYLMSSRGGELSCLDAATGAIIYQEKVDKTGSCWASPWAHEDKIYILDEKGVTSVIKAGTEFELLSQNNLDDKFWSSVAVAKDAYLFKGVKYLYCVKN